VNIDLYYLPNELTVIIQKILQTEQTMQQLTVLFRVFLSLTLMTAKTS